MLWGFKCYYASTLIIRSHSHTHIQPTTTHFLTYTPARTHEDTHTRTLTLFSPAPYIVCLQSPDTHTLTHVHTHMHPPSTHPALPLIPSPTHPPWCYLASKLCRINFNYIRAMRESIWRPWNGRWHLLRGEEKDWKQDHLGERCLYIQYLNVHMATRTYKFLQISFL